MPELSPHTATRPRLPIEGDVFAGSYRVLSLLGAGTSSKVYLAIHTGNHRRVAIKVFDASVVDEPAVWAERFEREAQLIAELKSPYTVTLFDSGQDELGRLFQVMEYVPGVTLDEKIRQDGPLSEVRAIRLIRQVLESLKEAHLKGILHRDIKPANVLVFDDMGEVDCAKVLDFGVATRFEDTQQGSKRGELVVGTPRYMSPEQLQGDELTSASDLYSVALLTIFLLNGAHPFGTQEHAVSSALAGESPQLVDALQVSERLKNVLRRLLSVRPADRYPDAAAVIAALEAIASLPDTHAPVADVPSGFPMTAEIRGAPTAHYMKTGEATLSMLVKSAPKTAVVETHKKLWWGWFVAVALGLALLITLLMF